MKPLYADPDQNTWLLDHLFNEFTPQIRRIIVFKQILWSVYRQCLTGRDR